MDVEGLLALMGAWLESHPTVRGHIIEDVELRLRGYGEGRIAVWLRSKNPAAELRAIGRYLVEKLDEVRAKDLGKVVAPPTPPDFPETAFADFADLDELEQIFRGEKQARFYFDDETELTGDPLRDR